MGQHVFIGAMQTAGGGGWLVLIVTNCLHQQAGRDVQHSWTHPNLVAVQHHGHSKQCVSDTPGYTAKSMLASLRPTSCNRWGVLNPRNLQDERLS